MECWNDGGMMSSLNCSLFHLCVLSATPLKHQRHADVGVCLPGLHYILADKVHIRFGEARREGRGSISLGNKLFIVISRWPSLGVVYSGVMGSP